VLEFQNVTYQYPNEPQATVSGLSFSVSKGEFVSLIGVSGCGKSTVFKLINGLLKPQDGSITVNGEDILKQKRYCGYMPQRDLLFPWRTVLDNLRLPLEIAGENRAESAEKAQQMLAEIGLEGQGDKFPYELSGGMRQRVAFGRTALTGSELLLLDEPFSALDFLTRVSMQEWLIKQYEHQKKTILFITHDVEEAIFLSSKILVVTDSPIAKLREIDVPLPYPRSRDMLSRVAMIELKENLLAMLREQVSE